jgi:hypothetical protein
MEYYAEGERFENCQEGAHAIVDVVVCDQAGWREELAVEYGEDDLVNLLMDVQERKR